MAMVEVGGVRLAYDEAGSGPPVVLVHAALADRRMWEHQFAALAANHRTIRYDWRGYGESGDAAGEFAHHEDLLGLLDALDVDRAALIGCSMGGAHAVDVALTAPDRVSGLALICSGLSGHRWPPAMLTRARERIYRAVPADRLRRYGEHTAERIDPADITAMAQAQLDLMLVGPDRDRGDLAPRVWESALAMCEKVFAREWAGPPNSPRELDPPADVRLAEVRVPALVLAGSADIPEIRDVSTLLADGIPGARRVDLPTGHLPPVEAPERVSALLSDFLTTL
ncbi:alpha/beta fold hydrolase [Rugosimonospora africana]|uniref:Alpha/beta hydrolase n=1 Tax=Rugosimonospora africana TaxID=556532 RepID=A0A8J3VRN1_9ACTN|nr:alpha/beta hydrolase [Rugosimonospora africana]GIH15671.1 alpha/beta hydrolase [Rugosimonospora africana]